VVPRLRAAERFIRDILKASVKFITEMDPDHASANPTAR